MLFERKPFYHAALEAGYSESVAHVGQRQMRENSPGFVLALQDEAKRVPTPEELRAMAIATLAQDIRKGRSRGLVREIECLGRFKEHDWFVKNQDTQVGILLDVDIAEARTNIDEFKDK